MIDQVEIETISIVFEEQMDKEMYTMPFSTSKLNNIEVKKQKNLIYISFRSPYTQFNNVVVRLEFDKEKTKIDIKDGFYYMINYPPKYHEETLKYYKFLLIPFKGDILKSNNYDNFMGNLKKLPDQELIDFLLL